MREVTQLFRLEHLIKFMFHILIGTLVLIDNKQIAVDDNIAIHSFYNKNCTKKRSTICFFLFLFTLVRPFKFS